MGSAGRFPAPGAGQVVVVGAGTAGCVVAGRLGEAGYSVVMLEAGAADPPSSDQRLLTIDYLQAKLATQRWWPSTRIFRGEGDLGERSVPHLAGRGLGGSSAVNGVIADIDLDDPALGSSDEVRAAFARCRLPIDRPDVGELGELDRALLAFRGSRLLALHRVDGRRADIAAHYLNDVGDVRIVGGALVERIVEGAYSGDSPELEVVTASGESFDAVAVVVCAGTLQTPAILRRSRIGHDVGVGVQSHPAVSIPIVRRQPASRSEIVSAVAVERGPVQLLALDHVAASPTPAGNPDAALLVALMRPIGAAGRIEMVSDDCDELPLARLRSFDDRRNLAALRHGVRWVLELLSAAPLAELIDVVPPVVLRGDSDQTKPLSSLADDELDVWIRSEPGAHAHLAGGCSIGRTLDADGRVNGTNAIYVADASAFPSIPRTGPHLPTIVQAEQLTARWCRAKMQE